MQQQLTLDDAVPWENPNAWMFHPDGTPKLLLWPGDDIRLAHQSGTACPRPDGCPVCSPAAFRCAYGCCPPGDGIVVGRRDEAAAGGSYYNAGTGRRSGSKPASPAAADF